MQTVYSMIHPDDYAQFRNALEEAILGTTPFNIDFRFILPDGEIRRVHNEGEVHCDANGTPVEFFGTVLDITER